MAALSLLPAVLAFALTAAHGLRLGDMGLFSACLGCAGLLFSRRAFVRLAAIPLLGGAALFWANTALELAALRRAFGEPWLRLGLILGGVAALCLAAAWLLTTTSAKKRFPGGAGTATLQAAAMVLTMAILELARAKAGISILLADRFFPGFGRLEILALAVYAALLAGAMADPARARRLRPRYWGLFSAVFFAQLALGLAGLPDFLMTGALHLPVPALIVGGPLYRGGGFFMPILYLSTLFLVGPAWCSHLCYIGAWDDAASRLGPKPPASLPRHAWLTRSLALALTVLSALALRLLGVPGLTAAILAAAFGLVGVLVMLAVSRRRGMMVHCTAYCPIGLVGNLLGRLSPWRLRMDAGCDRFSRCGRCSQACRYGALSERDVSLGRPGLSCTLCGDCVGVCPRKNPASHMGYRLFGLSPDISRQIFLAVVISLHAVFLGVARI
ncbi:4Fe-4S binding protein [Desulfovibrio sulfodismutans]|uniref:4Fe-4S binding protein n=1 Tax=Desulfolutivibrio sulfodismutans TaxID=63561 RepID=A0A7K3NHR3_9BACT|nr:4Fe-4S binding protein [Desulfolutivibrio sulfodismutans]NDY55744.1 4Fe-4S binding protein [Desulfolutivibrio sulfodismutans]QLA13364.1 4Fe-4S binding protein [Desulfolutivibrio sulfodismutans DSM 3696]